MSINQNKMDSLPFLLFAVVSFMKRTIIIISFGTIVLVNNSSVFSQELFDVYRCSFITSAFSDTVYVNSSNFEITYSDESGLPLSKLIYDNSCEAVHYISGPLTSEFSTYYLSEAKWVKNELVLLFFEGPGGYTRLWDARTPGIISIIETDSLNNGKLLEYDSNGFIRKKGSIYDGLMNIVEYYPNGIPSKRYTCVGFSDIKCDSYFEYFEDGSLSVQGSFLSSDLMKKNSDSSNIKDGEWMYYDRSGKIIKVEKYRKGKLV